MPASYRILMLVFTVFPLLIILELVRRGKLRAQYSLLLLLIGGILLTLPLFAGALARAASFLGVRIAPSLLDAVLFVLIFGIQIAQAVMISSLSIQCRDLTQKVAEQEWHLGQLRTYARMLAEQHKEQGAVLPATVHEGLTSAVEIA
jgi:hypothetical protein